MKKHLERTGNKTILSVTPLEITVKIELTDGTSFYITKEDYLNKGLYFYPGKELSSSVIKSLEVRKDETKNYAYLYSLITSGRFYSEEELKERLMRNKKLSFREASLMVEKITEEGSYSEEERASLLFLELKQKGLLLNKILLELAKRKVKKETIAELRNRYQDAGINEDKEEESIKEALSSLKGRNRKAIVDNAVKRLMKKGYSPSIKSKVEDYISKHIEIDEEIRKTGAANLENEYNHLSYSLRDSALSEKEKKDYIYKRLLGRFYSPEDIIKEMEKRR